MREGRQRSERPPPGAREGGRRKAFEPRIPLSESNASVNRPWFFMLSRAARPGVAAPGPPRIHTLSGLVARIRTLLNVIHSKQQAHDVPEKHPVLLSAWPVAVFSGFRWPVVEAEKRRGIVQISSGANWLTACLKSRHAKRPSPPTRWRGRFRLPGKHWQTSDAGSLTERGRAFGLQR